MLSYVFLLTWIFVAVMHITVFNQVNGGRRPRHETGADEVLSPWDALLGPRALFYAFSERRHAWNTTKKANYYYFFFVRLGRELDKTKIFLSDISLRIKVTL